MTVTNIKKATDSAENSYLTAFRDLENRVETMFHSMWKRPFHHETFPDTFTFGSLNKMPKIDVVDRDKEISVKAELPGFEKDDLDISITDNRLAIRAKTCKEEKQEKGDYLKQEISRSEVYRSVLLPAEVDDKNIKTSFKNGVLELTIAKQGKSQRKQIEVE